MDVIFLLGHMSHDKTQNKFTLEVLKLMYQLQMSVYMDHNGINLWVLIYQSAMEIELLLIIYS